MRLLVAFLSAALITACTAATSTPPPTPESSGRTVPAAGGRTTWVFAGTLLRPVDPDRYENVLLDAQPLRDGGWVVLREDLPRRGLADPTVYGGSFKVRSGRLLRLDAGGRAVAEEHGAEPFGLQRIAVFEDAGVVVGEGKQVLNGTLHSFHLDTLDGIASELTSCVPVAGRCWSYRTERLQGSTALEERDPRNLSVIRTYPHLTMDGLASWPQPAIYPQQNLIAWASPAGSGSGKTGLRVEPIDPSVPVMIPWLSRLSDACDVFRVGDDRAVVIYGPAGCRGDTGWTTQLVEVTTGRVVRDFGSDAVLEVGARGARLIDIKGGTPDPRTGADGPVFAGAPLAIDWESGAAATELADGGAAVWRRVNAGAAERSLSFTTIASARCPLDFARVTAAMSVDTACPPLAGAGGRGGLLVSTGRGYNDPSDFDVVRVTADATARTLTVTYRPGSSARAIQATAPGRAIALADPPSGEWFVRLMPEGAAGGRGSDFAVSLP